MNPFKIKILVDQYEQMGYELKTGDTLYEKNWNGNYVVYCELVKFDAPAKCWFARKNTAKTFPIRKQNRYIDIVVVPFDQYVKKVKQHATVFKGKENDQQGFIT
jgi:hypothetical protein